MTVSKLTVTTHKTDDDVFPAVEVCGLKKGRSCLATLTPLERVQPLLQREEAFDIAINQSWATRAQR